MKNEKKIVMELFSSKLAKSSLLLIFGIVLSGIMGYIFQIIMGRMLGVVEYASLSALLALYAILTTPLMSIMMLVSRKVSEYRATEDKEKVIHLFKKITIIASFLSLIFLGIFSSSAPLLKNYLKLENTLPIYILGALTALTIFPILNNAFMQGLQKFVWFSSLGVLNVFLKIIFASLMIIMGYGVSGAILGVLLSLTIITVLGYSILLIFSEKNPRKIKSDFKGMGFKEFTPIFIANLAFILMTQLDIVLVNYYFSSEESGIYAAASILGKAVMYLPSGIALAMFPMVAENNARSESSSYLLFQAVKLTALLSGLGALFYFLFGERVVLLLYGDSFAEAGHVLKYFGIAIFPMTLVMVAEHFLIAKGRVLFAYLFAAMAPFQILAIYFFHENLLTIVLIMGLTGLISATTGYWLLWRAFRAKG